MLNLVKKHNVLLLIAVTLFATAALSHIAEQNEPKNSVSVSASIATKTPNEKTMAAVIKSGELDLVDLNGSSNITNIDKDGAFSHPVISRDKNYIAYLKDGNLYVSEVTGKKTKVMDASTPFSALSYTWMDGTNLLYSPESGGIYVFDAKKCESTPYVKNEFYYENMTIGTDKKIYAEKYLYYAKDGGKYIQDYGVVLLPPDSKKEQLIIKSIPSDFQNNLGMYPVIAGISKDSRFLYIFEHPHSASMAADGMSLAFFDTESNKYIKTQNKDMMILGYKDNFSPCSKNGELLALISGGGRQMNFNKTLGIMNAADGTFEELLPSGQAAMTPSYSSDCKNILYAASQESKGIENLGEWIGVKHPIYSINVDTKKVSQLTDSSTGFDFAPVYINATDIVFLRITTADGDASLWELQNGKETKLIDKLIFYSDQYKIQDYYGHFNYNNYIDIK